MKKIFIIIFLLLLITSTSLILLRYYNVTNANLDLENHEIFVVTHVNDALQPEIIRSMLDELEVVSGIQLCVWVGNNNTGAIWDAKERLQKWLEEFGDLKIVIQCDYAFESKYGIYQKPFWVYQDTQTLSQKWYNNWYGNLSEVLNQHSNVILMVGFNEPYNHFKTKDMAQTIVKREYLTWKNVSTIPFSTEFLMPRIFWADYWGFPENITIEKDLEPFWKDYSDYIGVNLWAQNAPPQYHHSVGTSERVEYVIETCQNYSKKLEKPIHVNEFPTWNTTLSKYIFENVCKYPNIGQIYQLWYWGRTEDIHIDGWSYGLYNIDYTTHQITRAKPSWYIFQDLFNPNS